jgi:nicotinamidase/pyrazinamidase
VQNDFCPGGSLPVPDGDQVVPVINRMLIGMEGGHFDVKVATLDWHENPGAHFGDPPDYVDSWPRHCEVGTTGAMLHPNLDHELIYVRFYKGQHEAAYSGFQGTSFRGKALEEYLRGARITDVTIVGLATDFCVKATALDAARLGFSTTVYLPGCRGIAAPVGESDTLTLALQEMREAGITLIEA